MRGALLATAAVALLAVPAALANGDPASDELIVKQVYIGLEVPLSNADKDRLTKTVEAANKQGYTIRVALIAFTGDLGSAISLWKHPESYSKFLGSELAFAYSNRLLIAMPSGFGFYNGRAQPDPTRADARRTRALDHAGRPCARRVGGSHGPGVHAQEHCLARPGDHRRGGRAHPADHLPPGPLAEERKRPGRALSARALTVSDKGELSFTRPD